MTRMIASAAVLVALAGTFCSADDYGPTPAPAPAPRPAPAPAPNLPGEPLFTEMQLYPGAGQAANGLTLTLMADRVALPEMPTQPGQPLLVQPTALHLLFRNVSTHPLVLDAYNIELNRLILIVVGPEKKTVAIIRKPLIMRSREPLPIDFPQLEPGNPFVPLAPLQFPGDFNALVYCGLYKPGDYKVQVVYSRVAAGGPTVWQGTVVSNTLSFRIAGPMPPENPNSNNAPEIAPAPAPTPQAFPQPNGPPT
jgi:hypothetical protein